MIGIGFLVLGAALMLLQRQAAPGFFRRRMETADPGAGVGGSRAKAGG